MFGKGRDNTDFGSGFYCTEHLELAKEWAVGDNVDGYANEYILDTSGLKVLNLCRGYSVLNWMALLLKNRDFNLQGELLRKRREYILDHFLVDISDFDVIRGYRADDSYYQFAQMFLNGIFGVKALGLAMHEGDLGEQIVLKSERSFERISYIGSEVALWNEYYKNRCNRFTSAQSDVLRLVDGLKGDLFIGELMNEGVENGDPRLF